MADVYSASPDEVFNAVQRAVIASGGTIQSADGRTQTVFFKRGRKSHSVTARPGPDGVVLVGSSEGLHQFVASELARIAPPLAAQPPQTPSDLASELERLGDLRERNLLTDDEFAFAKERAFSRTEKSTADNAPQAVTSASPPTPEITPPPSAPTSRVGVWLAAWHRLSRRTQIIVAIVVVVAAVAGLGALESSDSEQTTQTTSASETTPPTHIEQPTTATQTTVESPVGSGVDPSVAAWAVDVAEWSEHMSDAFNELGSLLQDDSFNTQLLLGDDDATIQIAIPLAVMQQCSNTFPDPPANNARARGVARTIMRACDQFERSASQFARGVDNLDMDLIVAASRSMQRGNTIVRQATGEIDALRNG